MLSRPHCKKRPHWPLLGSSHGACDLVLLTRLCDPDLFVVFSSLNNHSSTVEGEQMFTSKGHTSLQ